MLIPLDQTTERQGKEMDHAYIVVVARHPHTGTYERYGKLRHALDAFDYHAQRMYKLGKLGDRVDILFIDGDKRVSVFQSAEF